MSRGQLWIHVAVASIAVSVAAEPLDAPITFVGWLVPLLGALLLLLLRPRGLRVLLPWWPWILYSGASVLLHGYDNAVHRYIILVTPLFVGAASATVRWDEALRKTLARDLALLVVALFGASVTVWALTAQDDVVLLAPHSILAVILFWYFFTEYQLSRERKAALLFALALVVPVVAKARTALAVAGLLAVFGVSGLPLRKRILMGVLVALAAGAVFASETFSEKMLLDPSAGLSVDNLRTSGRSVAWAILAEKVPENWVFGHGSNASEHYLLPVSEHFSHPHNDWLRLVFEYGAVGTVLFATGLAATARAVRRKLVRAAIRFDGAPAPRGNVASAAYSMIGAMAALMVTDNVILYAAFFGVLQFMFVGFCSAAPRGLVPADNGAA